jgi:hypothetical protein
MISKSPERNTFQKQSHINHAVKNGEEPNHEFLKMWDDWIMQADQKELDPEWQKDNMEYDLRTSEWILEKVKASDNYAQNLYAAMCNNEFQKLDVVPILIDKRWSCSWRHAGGIIADMQQKGDYINWYCSGIRDIDVAPTSYVSEGTVTDLIQADLKRLGWILLNE